MEAKLKIWAYSQSYRIDGTGTLIERANDFFLAAEVNGLSMDTVRTYAFALMAFFRWLKSDWDAFEGATQKTLQDWMHAMQRQGMKPRSINKRLTIASSFYRYAFGKAVPHAPGVLYPKAYYRGPRRIRGRRAHGASPFHVQLKVKVPHQVMDPLKPSEIDLFLRNIRRYRDLAIVLTMLLCGLRSQEVTAVRVEDVDFHQSSLRVRGKGRRERMVPMPFRLMQVFERYLELERPTTSDEHFFLVLQGERAGKKMSRDAIRWIFRHKREKLGLPKARAHQFRHAFASDLARVGVPLTTIQKLLGHADPQTTLIYIELFLDDIRAEYDRAISRIEERYAALPKQTTT